MGLIVTLIIVGLILIFAEVLIIPGVGVAGILGLLSLGGSCFYAFCQMGNTVGAIVTAVNVVLVVGLTVYVLRAKTWKRLSLDTNIDSKAVADDSALEIGDKVMTISRLAPMGSVRFDTELVECCYEGRYDCCLTSSGIAIKQEYTSVIVVRKP